MFSSSSKKTALSKIKNKGHNRGSLDCAPVAVDPQWLTMTSEEKIKNLESLLKEAKKEHQEEKKKKKKGEKTKSTHKPKHKHTPNVATLVEQETEYRIDSSLSPPSQSSSSSSSCSSSSSAASTTESEERGAYTCQSTTSAASLMDSQDPRFKSILSMESPEKNYELGRVIGSGAGGAVRIGMPRKDDEEPVAIKTVEMLDADQSRIRNEAVILSSLHHKNIVKFVSCYLSENRVVWIVLELCTLGNFASVLCNAPLLQKENHPLTPSAVLWTLNGLLSALEFMHAKELIHRDIKSNNILIAGDGTPKLADFGFAARLTGADKSRRSVVGTPYWMPPEIVNCRPYTDRADIWSFGIVIHEAVTGKPPHFMEGQSPTAAFKRIVKEGAPLPAPEELAAFPKALRDLLADCLQMNDRMRPSAAQIREAFGKMLTQQSDRGRDDLILSASIVNGSAAMSQR